MSLNERKLKILNIIINSYMQNGEPVGSRTVSKHPGLGISSATVRNEMTDLEEEGYIIQPHTSAGRIPTDKAYRLYVDNLLKEKREALNTEIEEFNKKSKILDKKVDKLEQILHKIAIKLADDTNYTTIVTQPSSPNKIKFIQISLIEKSKLIIVCVTKSNVIKNDIIELDSEIEDSDLLKLNFVVNSNFNDKTIDEISISDIALVKKQLSFIDEKVITKIIDTLANMFYSDKELEIYTGGTTNILKYPELSTNSNFEGLLSEIVEKQELSKFMSNENSRENDIQIYIGDESKISKMNDCSLVTMNFDIKNGMRSTIGIIGPKRMDYKKVLENLGEIRRQINDLFDD